MSLPFTTDQFLNVLAAYNTAVWPLQTAAYAMGVLAVVLLGKGTRTSDRIIIFILAVMWIWTGVVYHIIFFSRINAAAYLFGALSVLEGILILLAGYRGAELSFRFRAGAGPVVGAVFILYAMVIYPLFGYFSGHIYPRSPVFGVTPCPVTIFTFGLFLFSLKRVPVYILILPFLWSLVGGSAAWNLGIPEDYGLILAGVGGSVLILLENRRKAG